MPVKMVICTICQDEVTKRSTLSLKELGFGEGRACRKHEKVKQLVEALHENQQQAEDWQQLDWNMRIMFGAAFVRTTHTFIGMPLWIIYGRFEELGYPGDLIEAIKIRVAEEGGPKMSEEEILNTAAMTAVMIQRSLVKPPEGVVNSGTEVNNQPSLLN